ncbi:hypothetical protein WG906_08675 [Pedobacter sp. P351]|uniref:hypothetical protein n=1 Tax=Pedobacter superstes TaxID=3133441 RepID=UPI00309C1B8B
MKKPLLFTLLFILALSDILLLNMSHFFGYLLTNKFLVDVDQTVYFGNIWGSNILWLICSAIFGMYTLQSFRQPGKIYRSTLRTICLYVGLFSAYLLLNPSSFPIEFLASLVPLIGMSFISSRVTARALRQFLPATALASLGSKNINASDNLTA